MAIALGALLSPSKARALPLTPEELAKVCAEADDAAHCGRLVEEVQLPRLPNLAVRDKLDLRVSLYPSGIATFTDTETLHGGRSYSLWDFMSEINAVVLYVTDGDDALLRYAADERPQVRPAERSQALARPPASRDRDFCERRCVNELALWRVTKDGVRKELWWRPKETWADAVATWKDAQTIVVDHSLAGTDKRARSRARSATAIGSARPDRERPRELIVKSGAR
jgi:hypothetical protein